MWQAYPRLAKGRYQFKGGREGYHRPFPFPRNAFRRMLAARRDSSPCTTKKARFWGTAPLLLKGGASYSHTLPPRTGVGSGMSPRGSLLLGGCPTYTRHRPVLGWVVPCRQLDQTFIA